MGGAACVAGADAGMLGGELVNRLAHDHHSRDNNDTPQHNSTLAGRRSRQHDALRRYYSSI